MNHIRFLCRNHFDSEPIPSLIFGEDSVTLIGQYEDVRLRMNRDSSVWREIRCFVSMHTGPHTSAVKLPSARSDLHQRPLILESANAEEAHACEKAARKSGAQAMSRGVHR